MELRLLVVFAKDTYMYNIIENNLSLLIEPSQILSLYPLENLGKPSDGANAICERPKDHQLHYGCK